jgi:hypothetical protein
MVYAEDEVPAPFFLKKNGFRGIIRWAGSGEMLQSAGLLAAPRTSLRSYLICHITAIFNYTESAKESLHVA